MRVAAYYPWIYLRGGAERTILETLRRSRHDWTLFTNRYDREATFPIPDSPWWSCCECPFAAPLPRRAPG
jgi:hypothetical protein